MSNDNTASRVAAGDAPGLVTGRISRRGSAGIAIRPGGIRVKLPASGRSRTGGGARGEICGFSVAARRRMREMVSRIDWLHAEKPWGTWVPFFVTLTYHRESVRSEQAKRDLWAFLKRIGRQYPDEFAGVIWKLEPQERGTWHFHLLVWFRKQPSVKALRSWTSAAWNEVAEPGDLEHLAAGTQVKRVKNTFGPEAGRLLRYLTKYLGKAFEAESETGEPVHTGRCWGVVGSPPVSPDEWLRMPIGEVAQLVRRVRRWGFRSWYLAQLGRRGQVGFLVLGDVRFGGLGQLLRGLQLEQACRVGLSPG